MCCGTVVCRFGPTLGTFNKIPLIEGFPLDSIDVKNKCVVVNTEVIW